MLTSSPRRLMLAMGAALLLPLSACAEPKTAGAQTIDPDTREGYLKIQRKIQCNLQDNKEETYVWQGRAYARVQGTRDKHLFNLMGMNVRKCATVNDPKQGEGYRMVTREIMLYLDPKTNTLLKSWENPYTGDTVEVIHVANDPVNSRPNFGLGRDGKPLKFDVNVIGNTWQMNVEVPLFYHNVLGGEYQKYVGGTYHATEIFDFYGDVDELMDANIDSSAARVAWVRISDWLPWMEMNGRQGTMYFNAQGGKLESWDQLPDLMKAEIDRNYPAYRHAPPIDDKRPNETSWTFFKKIFDKRAKEAKPAPTH